MTETISKLTITTLKAQSLVYKLINIIKSKKI